VVEKKGERWTGLDKKTRFVSVSYEQKKNTGCTRKEKEKASRRELRESHRKRIISRSLPEKIDNPKRGENNRGGNKGRGGKKSCGGGASPKHKTT